MASLKNGERAPDYTDPRVVEALQALTDGGPLGKLQPRRLVEAAKDEDHVLHNSFQWDDEVCGNRYRLIQARRIINQACVYIQYEGRRVKQYQWVSLKTDRRDEGGYHPIDRVLSHRALRGQMLQDALDDIDIFRRKYQQLEELAEIFDAIIRVRNRVKRRQRK